MVAYATNLITAKQHNMESKKFTEVICKNPSVRQQMKLANAQPQIFYCIKNPSSPVLYVQPQDRKRALQILSK